MAVIIGTWNPVDGTTLTSEGLAMGASIDVSSPGNKSTPVNITVDGLSRRTEAAIGTEVAFYGAWPAPNKVIFYSPEIDSGYNEAELSTIMAGGNDQIGVGGVSPYSDGGAATATVGSNAGWANGDWTITEIIASISTPIFSVSPASGTVPSGSGAIQITANRAGDSGLVPISLPYTLFPDDLQIDITGDFDFGINEFSKSLWLTPSIGHDWDSVFLDAEPVPGLGGKGIRLDLPVDTTGEVFYINDNGRTVEMRFEAPDE